MLHLCAVGLMVSALVTVICIVALFNHDWSGHAATWTYVQKYVDVLLCLHAVDLMVLALIILFALFHCFTMIGMAHSMQPHRCMQK